MTELQTKIAEANAAAAAHLIHADPRWHGVMRARDLLPALGERTILHAGPPIAYENMCILHKRGMVNAVLMEGWASTPQEAKRMLSSGEVSLESAFDHPTVGSGTGIVTPSVPLLVVEDHTTGKRAGVFPSEGKFGGGFCGWGLYSPEIKENLEYMATTLFREITEVLNEAGGLPLGEIINQGLTMGDENHSSQTAVDALFLRAVIPHALRCRNKDELLTYFAATPRFFHNFGQAASRSALLSADGLPFSSMVTAAGGNGVEYGIKVAGLGDEWFTAPSPMIEGTYMTAGAKRENQLPWLGDSSVVECAGLGGLASGASPVVCSFRGELAMDGIRTTEQMRAICITSHPARKIPCMDFAELPIGIDIRSVSTTGILPVIDGGMLDQNGGWMGAGCAEIPLACFTRAEAAFRKKYGDT